MFGATDAPVSYITAFKLTTGAKAITGSFSQTLAGSPDARLKRAFRKDRYLALTTLTIGRSKGKPPATPPTHMTQIFLH